MNFQYSTIPRPLHFDPTVDNPERAFKFYKDVFGWKFEKWDGLMDYWMATTGDEEPGINDATSKKGESNMPDMNTISVNSVEEFSKTIQDNGGKVLMPKSPIPGVAGFATCQDTEGNTFGIMQQDSSAK